MNIIWHYLDKRGAAINALKDYGSMQYIIDHTDEEIDTVHDRMSSVGSPVLSDMPKGPHNSQANENRIIAAIDEIDVLKERYRQAWKRIRDSYVQQHPLCEVCQKEGRLVATEEVHHKVPLSEGGTHARDNLIALCKSCHARIHAERGDRWHNS